MPELKLYMCNSCYRNVADRGIKGHGDLDLDQLEEPVDSWVFAIVEMEDHDMYYHECEDPEVCLCKEKAPYSHTESAYVWPHPGLTWIEAYPEAHAEHVAYWSRLREEMAQQI